MLFYAMAKHIINGSAAVLYCNTLAPRVTMPVSQITHKED